MPERGSEPLFTTQDEYMAACDAAVANLRAAAIRAYTEGQIDGRTRLGAAVRRLLDVERAYPRA